MVTLAAVTIELKNSEPDRWLCILYLPNAERAKVGELDPADELYRFAGRTREGVQRVVTRYGIGWLKQRGFAGQIVGRAGPRLENRGN